MSLCALCQKLCGELLLDETSHLKRLICISCADNKQLQRIQKRTAGVIMLDQLKRIVCELSIAGNLINFKLFGSTNRWNGIIDDYQRVTYQKYSK